MPTGSIPVLVLGVLVVGVILILWWPFPSKDEAPLPIVADEPITLLTTSDLQHIERALGVTLPADYAQFLQQERPERIDRTSVYDHPGTIIELTQEYRELCDWPSSYIWIGSEDDACPRTIDCETGEIFRLEKGAVNKEWDRLPSFSSYVSGRMQDRG